MASWNLAFDAKPPFPLDGPSFSLPVAIQTSTDPSSFFEDIVIPLTWDETSNLPPNWTQHWSEEYQQRYYWDMKYGESKWTRPTMTDEVELLDANYLRFSFVDKVAMSSFEAEHVWPVLHLAAMKPQGPDCPMSKLGQGSMARHAVNLIASFLWYETSPTRHMPAHRSVSLDWANSCEIEWIAKVGARVPDELADRYGDNDKYLKSAGLWIHTNKDSFKLLDASDLAGNTAPRVEVAFQKGGHPWKKQTNMSWFVGVWVDGKHCKPHCWKTLKSRFEELPISARLHPGDAAIDLLSGGDRVTIQRNGWGEFAVEGLQIHAGKLFRDRGGEDILQRYDPWAARLLHAQESM